MGQTAETVTMATIKRNMQSKRFRPTLTSELNQVALGVQLNKLVVQLKMRVRRRKILKIYELLKA